jgi:drug/metabolite transporter (DMT)-like permease
MSHERHPLRGIALMVFAVFMFSSMDACAKWMVSHGYAVGPLVWARYAVHLALMILLLGPRHRLDLVRTRRPALHLLRGLLLLGCTGFFYAALQHLPLAEATAINFVGPVLVTLLSGWVLHEQVSRRQWAAVLLGFVGVLVIVRPGGQVFTPAVALPLAVALCFSGYQVVTRKVAGRENPVASLFWTAMIGTACTSLLLPWTWVTPTWTQAAVMVAMGGMGGLGHFSLIRAVEHTAPTALAPFAYTQLIWSTVLAWLVLGDFPDHGTIAGMLVIVGAGLLAIDWKKMRRATDVTDDVGGH